MKKILVILFVSLSIVSFSQIPEMVKVEGGTFTMGGTSSDRLDELPAHEVTVSDFYIAKYEVTFEEYDQFCSVTGNPKINDGNFGRGKLPVINVSWIGAIFYCNWMSSRFNYKKVYDLKVDSTGVNVVNVNWDANGFRLPTEAEWEYAAKGGKLGTQSGDIENYIWYEKNAEGTTHEVGSLEANKLGIFDIQGNAYEWCWDIYDKTYYTKSPADNPYGAETGQKRVYRGGCFSSSFKFLNTSRRFNFVKSKNKGLIGIRLVRTTM